MEVSSGTASPVTLALKGLVMSMMILLASASPYSLTTGTALSNSTARITMSPAGASPHVPAVAPLPSALARATALAVSRPMISTALPPLTARALWSSTGSPSSFHVLSPRFCQVAEPLPAHLPLSSLPPQLTNPGSTTQGQQLDDAQNKLSTVTGDCHPSLHRNQGDSQCFRSP